ncbi:MAG: VTT domain-containing protein [Desulfobacterales bacterium]|nr:VTT domain-containing protein [Desulfobacterales bacterium]
MQIKGLSGKYILWIVTALSVSAAVIFREDLVHLYYLLADRHQAKNFIEAFGPGAPVVFICIQIFQVIFAPIPGEATGFIGGYLFGTTNGFIYSSIGLAAGSWINFSIGRLLGRKYVRKLIPEHKMNRFDSYVKHQGVITLFILFIIPGFPKDWLSLFLGITALPLRVFIVIAAIGRMPGTLALSLQGEFLFRETYAPLILMAILSTAIVFVVYRFRKRIYRWVDRING